MKVYSAILLFAVVLPYFIQGTEGKVFCFRRVKKRGKCGGHLKKMGYNSPEECCAGRGAGFATRKQKVGRNRYTCTPCADLENETVEEKHRPKGRRRTDEEPTTTTTTAPATTTEEATTTQPPSRDASWPKPQTDQVESKYSYEAYPRFNDAEVVKIEWSEWSPCSASCGAGWRSRFKICDGCDNNDYENVLSQPCLIHFYCPVDGNWGPWFPWQPCSLSCGGGTRLRQRKCNYPPPAYGGENCPGPAVNEQDCNEQHCPIDGNWGEWSEYTLCSTTCGPGIKRRVRSCDNPSPANGGRECAGSAIVSRKCELSKCPQDGDWSLWSEWSQCTATCGSGVRTRTRACDSPRPLHGGKDCEGETIQESACRSHRPCPIDGGWSEWNMFGFCQAARCDWGFKIRTRLCSNPQPQHGGAQCQGNQYERVECFNEQDCPRNGTWCPWSEWSACSSSCAEQTSLKVRQRTCMCPEPRFGGQDCEGDSLNVRDCLDLPRCEKSDEEVDKKKPCGAGDQLEGSADNNCDQEEEDGETRDETTH